MTQTARDEADDTKSPARRFRLPRGRGKDRGGMSIGRKLILLVALLVTAGLGVLVALQFWNERKDLMHEATVYNGIITYQIADAVSGGVKWEKIEAIEKGYAELLRNADAGLASVMVFKPDGAQLAAANASDQTAYDLSEIPTAAGTGLESGGHYEEFTDGHLVMAYPIMSGADRIGTLAVAWSTDSLDAQMRDVLIGGVVVGFGVLVVLVGLLTVALSSSVTKPLGSMTSAMQTLAGGNHGIVVPALDRRDEIGDMARAVQVFKDNAIEVDRLKAEREAEQRRAAEERHNAMLELAAKFETDVGTLVDAVTRASTDLQSTADAMSSTAEESNRQANVVAAASEEASANVQTVASAAEELTSSIGEISRQVAQSAKIAGEAVNEADRTNARVHSLAEAAQKIGEVVSLINDIAAQTNLLALNATIEAARAGEAGKGFAVVANEVKSLANQTAKATDEIGAQIGAIQSSTSDAVSAIGGIGKIIREINEIAGSIAAAVEEQGAATQEIARNVQQAASGTSEVSTNIGGVTQAAARTGTAAGALLDAAKGLSHDSGRLRDEVTSFLSEVRAA